MLLFPNVNDTLITKLEPNIIISDIVMPMMDGVDFVNVVRKQYPQIQIVILSGYDKFEYVKSTMKSGVSDYILKPTLNPEQLLNTLKNCAAKIPGLQVKESNKVQYDKMLERYFLGYDSKEYQNLFQEHFIESQYYLVAFDIHIVKGENAGLLQAIYEKLEQFLSERNYGEGEIIPLKQDMACFLYNCGKKDASTFEQEVDELGKQLSMIYHRIFGVRSTALMSLNQTRMFYQKIISRVSNKTFYFKNEYMIIADYAFGEEQNIEKYQVP